MVILSTAVKPKATEDVRRRVLARLGPLGKSFSFGIDIHKAQAHGSILVHCFSERGDL